VKKERVKVNPRAIVGWCYTNGFSGRGEPYCTRVDQVDYGVTGRKQVYVTLRLRRPYRKYYELYPFPVTISKRNNEKEKGYYISINPEWDNETLVQILKHLSKDSLKREVIE